MQFLSVILGTLLFGVAGVGLGALLDAPISEVIAWSWRDAAIGVAATAPLGLFLNWFMRTDRTAIAKFRREQIEFFAGLGFELTWPRIILLALASGISEELFFRGFLQVYIDGFTPVAVSIFVTNVLFGLLHWRTAIYALIAGSVGIYLGVLFWLTGNLVAPMVAHGVYNFFAFILTRQSLRALQADRGR